MKNLQDTPVLAAEIQRQMRMSCQRLHRFQELSQDFEKITPELIEQTIADLAVALEELEVTVETLQQQHSMLIDTQDALVKEQQRYQQLFTLAPDGYLVTDPNRIVQEANLNGGVLLGSDPKYLIGKPFRVFVAPSHRQLYRQQIQQIQAEDSDTSIHEWEIALIRAANPDWEFPAAITASIARDSQGNPVSIHWSIRDISDRKAAEAVRLRLEKEQELSQCKSRLIRTVAHELRSPLNVFGMSIELLEIRGYSQTLPPELQLIWQKMERSYEMMLALIDNTLTLSSIELGKTRVESQKLDLTVICQDLAQKYQLYADRDQTLAFELVGTFQEAWLDRELLERILGNLLSNAIKYSRKGGQIQFTASARRDRVVFQIQDCGIGIPASDLEHLFEPFYRAQNTTQVHGNGLGLSIVQEAVSLLKGEIHCTSTENVGTTFTVELPWHPDRPISTSAIN